MPALCEGPALRKSLAGGGDLRRHERVNAAAMTVEEILALLRAGFPLWDQGGVAIENAAYRACRLRLAFHGRHLRAGGTVNGPTMFMLADTALFVAVLASVGPKPLAVTTNMSINFFRKPAPKDLIAKCRLLKLGKRLAVGEVFLYSDGDEEEAVAHATGTYSIPA
ncbi:MAG TPA: PaaI family thioesterase [Parvularculaceae bacterium]|nr:PaaI family thioesterase [Parvularculaceae bacterium]